MPDDVDGDEEMESLLARPTDEPDVSPTPVTVLTGFLGAGKTTLANRILSEDHGSRFW